MRDVGFGFGGLLAGLREMVFRRLISLCIIIASVGVVEAEPPPPPLQGEAILAHLGRTIAWFRRVQMVEPDTSAPDDLVSRDRLRETSTAALQLSFDFARAAVPIVNKAASGAESAKKPPTDTPDSNLDRAVARSAERIATLQSRLADLDTQRASAPAAQRKTLEAQRDEVQAALALAKDVQSTVQNLAHFAIRGSGAGQGGGLAAQIAQLERSVPEARHTSSSKPSTSTPAPAPTPTPSPAPASQPLATTPGTNEANLAPFHPEMAGLIALATQWFTLRAHRVELDDVMRQTDGVLKSIDDVRAPLVNTAREFMRQTDAVSTQTHDAAEAARTRQTLQDAAVEFKQISTLIIPIAEQAIATEASRGTLGEWRDRLKIEMSTTARYLIFRAATLGIVVGFVLLLSEIWRRATFRYLHDTRRRRQFLLLRRILVSVAIAIVVIIGVVSEMGSLATYVGFVTAGIAVAMQNVILAVVAYFFLIGRYGVRVGDRITLAGVTGNVIDIGLVRIYLMELAGGNLDPTGRIVVLSNAVLFQPQALFKQVPGADYVWRVITLTIDAAHVDAQQVEERLRAAADSVYEEFRGSIEAQHATLQRYVNIETRVPHPEVSVRLTSSAFECMIRYPADPARVAATNRKMIDALRAALAKEPGLTLVSSAGPAIE
jgi:small-conductance mechanosensitive channel